MHRRVRRIVPAFFCACSLAAGCARLGDLGGGPGATLAAAARRLPPGDPAGPGPLPIVARGIHLRGADFPVAIYRPRDLRLPGPAIVFLPGRLAPEDQYESYARALASRGFVVAVRGWYGPFHRDEELARDASRIADWLISDGLARPTGLGVAGHSMGAKDAILAALGDRRFGAVVALDPDDNGRHTVARGPVARLTAPLLLVGAEVAWKASRVCAPKDMNYQRFFEQAPAGTEELELRAADHVQVMDDPDRFGYSICRCGTAESGTVRALARGATVAFFVRHLLDGGAGLSSRAALATMALGRDAALRVKGALAGAAGGGGGDDGATATGTVQAATITPTMR